MKRTFRLMRTLPTLTAAILLAVGALPSASAEEMNRMALTGGGHGVLMSEKARAAAGVPEEIADYIWGMQSQLSEYRSELHKIPELGHKEVDTHAYLMKTLQAMGYKPQAIGASTGT